MTTKSSTYPAPASPVVEGGGGEAEQAGRRPASTSSSWWQSPRRCRRWTTAEYFAERKARADMDAFDRILSRRTPTGPRR